MKYSHFRLHALFGWLQMKTDEVADEDFGCSLGLRQIGNEDQ